KDFLFNLIFIVWCINIFGGISHQKAVSGPVSRYSFSLGVDVIGNKEIDPSEGRANEVTVIAVFLCQFLQNGKVLVSRRYHNILHQLILTSRFQSRAHEESGANLVEVVLVLIGERAHPRSLEGSIARESEFLGEIAEDGVRLRELLPVYFKLRKLTEKRLFFVLATLPGRYDDPRRERPLGGTADGPPLRGLGRRNRRACSWVCERSAGKGTQNNGISSMRERPNNADKNNAMHIIASKVLF
ncbi:hypothetical protein PMAYCL1PPCAC_14977, partial [Pristionchus mayeri]